MIPPPQATRDLVLAQVAVETDENLQHFRDVSAHEVDVDLPLRELTVAHPPGTAGPVRYVTGCSICERFGGGVWRS